MLERNIFHLMELWRIRLRRLRGLKGGIVRVFRNFLVTFCCKCGLILIKDFNVLDQGSNLWHACRRKNLKWDSNPRPKIFDHMFLIMSYWWLLRSLAECKLRLFYVSTRRNCDTFYICAYDRHPYCRNPVFDINFD